MKNKIVTGLILTALVGVAGLLPACSNQNASTQQQLVKVQKGDIAVTVASDGNISLINDRELTFGTSGIIKEIDAKEGDIVTQGQVLAKLDTAPMELNVASAALGVRSAELDLQVANDSYQKITYPYTFSTLAFSVPDSLARMTDAQRNLDDIQKTILGSLDYFFHYLLRIFIQG